VQRVEMRLKHVCVGGGGEGGGDGQNTGLSCSQQLPQDLLMPLHSEAVAALQAPSSQRTWSQRSCGRQRNCVCTVRLCMAAVHVLGMS
jgi:hypothetical protein